MKKIAYNLPITASSVMLGLASLGNLLGTYSEILRDLFGIISLLFLILIIIKFVSHKHIVLEELRNPAIFSTFVTLTAGCMVLTTYLIPVSSQLMELIWYSMIVIQFIIMGIFTYKLVIKNFDYNKIVPGWLVTYVGIGIVGVTAPYYLDYLTGQIVTIFSASMYCIVLPIVLKRTIFDKNFSKPILATICILPAPANLILIGYINCFQNINMYVVYSLWLLGISFYFFAFKIARQFIFKEFYPSLAAMTFPFVVCAASTKLLIDTYQVPFFFNYIYIIELFISVFFVVAVAYRFLKFSIINKNII